MRDTSLNGKTIKKKEKEDMTESQKKLIEIVEKLGRRGPVIPAGPDQTDQFGRKLLLKGQFINKTGDDLNEEAKSLLSELQKPGSEIELILRGQVMWYDIRSSVWMENPSLSALLALVYAKELVERTGKKDGHTLNVAIDCYPKHHISISAFVDTLIRTGIVENGGGVIYWGVQNGGSIRNVSMAERAFTGVGGNWIYGTMSHRSEDYVGAKFGMQGKVFCGPDLMENLYGKLIKGDFAEIKKIDNPEDFVVTVGDLTQNNIDLLEDLIRARTGTKISKEEFLKGTRVGLNMSGSPVGKNLLDILSAFGADIEAENCQINENFNISNIIDPNERDSKAMEKLKEMAEENKRIYLALDPDGDRGTVIALNSKGKAIALAGTELLLLAAENLATYNPKHLPNDIIFDMRTGLAIELLAEALKKFGNPIKLIASEPGYPFFMEAMGNNKDAVIAVENTCHMFITPYTNPIWGAEQYLPSVQGGDDAAISLVYLLALSNLHWDKRNPIEQLDYIRQKYGFSTTLIREFKPKVDKKDAMRKYDLAREMCKITKEELGGGRYFIDTMNSGVRLIDKKSGATVLIRYSNTGPSFTASGEAITEEDSDMMFLLGAAIMNLAVANVRKTKGNFIFDWGDFSSFGKMSTDEARMIIEKAK